MKHILQIALLLVLTIGSVSPVAPSFAQGQPDQPTPAAPGAAPSAGMAPAGDTPAAALAPGGPPLVAYHAVTGKARFVSAAPGQALSAAPGFTAGVDTPEQAARVFVDQYAAEFGLRHPASELQVKRTRQLEPGLDAVRFQQVYNGVPVFGGDLTVHVDDTGAARVAIGEMAPDLNISTQPQIDAAQASAWAIEYVAKQYGYDPAGLQAAQPALWIYNPALLDFRGVNDNRLVWRTEITSTARADLRELALVDAVTGGMALNFNQVDDLLVRRIYDNNNNPALGLPGGSPVRVEGDGPVAVTDADNAYDYGGATYNFYHNIHGRDSYDDAGAALVQTVRYCPDAANCPYANANWNGTQMLYGDGYASGDDIVAHELTHAVTQYESGLFYWMQSGAINESFSDIWGEIVDLGYTNGQDNDTAGVRWQMGEDLPIGAIRNMSNPGPFNDPDKMSSFNFYCGYNDRGGVHGNSGVGNKAAALMVDGGVFNGYTISGIGAAKTARIFYRVQTGLLNSASDYADLNDALAYACSTLVGQNGITAGDCDNVRKTLAAVEMGVQPGGCAVPDARVCEISDFSSSFNGAAGGWTAVNGGWATDADSLNGAGSANRFTSVTRPAKNQDVNYEAIMRRSGCALCANGLLVRGASAPVDAATGKWPSAYQFGYTNSGMYSVYKLTPSLQEIPLMPWTSSPDILDGGWNTLRVATRGSVMRFYINGTLVWTGSDGDFDANRLGLAMYSDVSGGGNVLEIDTASASGGTPTQIYRETFADGLGAWTPAAAAGPYNFALFTDGYATSDRNSVFGPDRGVTTDYSLTGPAIALPAGRQSFLRFNHYFAVETNWDGGVVEYSRNGGPWTDAGALFTDAGYTSALNAGSALAGRQAFTGNYKGYLSSRLDLTPLAGGAVRFRFRFASDSTGFSDGWFIDDPTVYTCSSWTVQLPWVKK